MAYTLPAYGVDLAGQPVTVTGAVVKTTPTPVGLGASGWQEGSIYETVGVGAVPIVGDVAQSAITVVFHRVTAAASGTGMSLFAERGSAGNPIANLVYGSGNALRIVWRDNAATLINQAGTRTIIDGLAHVGSIVRTSATTFELWVDGSRDLNITSGSMTTTFSDATLTHRIGGDAGDTGSFAFPGTIVAVILHRNRSLSAAEVAQLHADPFCLLRS